MYPSSSWELHQMTGYLHVLSCFAQAGEDKQRRQNIHKAVKAAFPMFETQTDVRDGQKVIVVNYKKSGGKFYAPDVCEGFAFL